MYLTGYSEVEQVIRYRFLFLYKSFFFFIYVPPLWKMQLHSLQLSRLHRQNLVLRHSVPPFSLKFSRHCVLRDRTQCRALFCYENEEMEIITSHILQHTLFTVAIRYRNNTYLLTILLNYKNKHIVSTYKATHYQPYPL